MVSWLGAGSMRLQAYEVIHSSNRIWWLRNELSLHMPQTQALHNILSYFPLLVTIKLLQIPLHKGSLVRAISFLSLSFLKPHPGMHKFLFLVHNQNRSQTHTHIYTHTDPFLGVFSWKLSIDRTQMPAQSYYRYGCLCAELISHSDSSIPPFNQTYHRLW